MAKLKFPEALKGYEELEDSKLIQRTSYLGSRGTGRLKLGFQLACSK